MREGVGEGEREEDMLQGLSSLTPKTKMLATSLGRDTGKSRKDTIVPRTRTVRFEPQNFYHGTPALPLHLKDINIDCEQLKSHLNSWLFVESLLIGDTYENFV